MNSATSELVVDLMSPVNHSSVTLFCKELHTIAHLSNRPFFLPGGQRSSILHRRPPLPPPRRPRPQPDRPRIHFIHVELPEEPKELTHAKEHLVRFSELEPSPTVVAPPPLAADHSSVSFGVREPPP
jgi:hypothetical protein